MTLDTQTATLIASGVAATAALATLIVNVWAAWRGDLRTAQRKSLEAFIAPLGEALHETVATTHILLKTRTEVSATSWRDRSQTAKTKCHELLPKLRYPLYGITDAIRTLTRLPDWVEHARAEFPVHAKNICDVGTKLSGTLDRVIRDCYAFGRPPTRRNRLLISYRVWRFRAAYRKFQDSEAPKK